MNSFKDHMNIDILEGLMIIRDEFNVVIDHKPTVS